jgi:hypothetical protein
VQRHILHAIIVFLTLSGSASAALKPLRGTLELACKQQRFKANGELATIFFRTTADIANISGVVEKYKAGRQVSKEFQPLFDFSWSQSAKGVETACVQIKGDTGDNLNGRYLLRVIVMKNNPAKFINDAIIGEPLEDILYESAK